MIDAHRGAFEYDWRARFHLPLTVIGRRMTFGEAMRLTRVLMRDPSSVVFAAVQGWEHPFPWEAMILADLVDVQVAKASKRTPKPWPRPWSAKPKAIGTAMSIADLEATIARVRAIA